MARNSESLNTLISTSSTIAGMGLAIVGILAAKQSMQYSEMISDDMFLFSSIGFLLVVVIGYLAQKHSEQHYYARLVRLAEWLFRCRCCWWLPRRWCCCMPRRKPKGSLKTYPRKEIPCGKNCKRSPTNKPTETKSSTGTSAMAQSGTNTAKSAAPTLPR